MNLNNVYQDVCARPSDIRDHLPTLSRLASGRTVVEFGVRAGLSTVAFMHGRPSKMTSYDIVAAPAHLGPLARDSGIDWTFVQGDSRHVDIGPCDLLFIDTVHTEPQLSVEIERHHRQVRDLIVLHDTAIPVALQNLDHNDSPGMWRAIDRFTTQRPWRVAWHDEACNGLTALEPDPEVEQ